jgi:5-methyltetrahydrofolate--homocysteine methyltransferase
LPATATPFDLGKQVPVNTILEKAVEVGADAIGLSALLVSTSRQMPICLEEQEARGLHFPVIVGGAAINRDFGRRIALVDDGARFFESGDFYAFDTFEDLFLLTMARVGCVVSSSLGHRRQRRAALGYRSSRLRAVESAARRRAGPAVLGNARARRKRHRSARRLAVLRPAQPLSSVVGCAQQ